MIKRNLVPIIVVAISMFAGIGLTAFAIDSPQSSTTTTDSLDVTLNERVEILLRTDIGLAGGQFSTQTKAGVVTLGGTVPDEQSLRRALDLASSVKGVREIRNGMVVETPK
jgi:osmotically-inducible protein OsmY